MKWLLSIIFLCLINFSISHYYRGCAKELEECREHTDYDCCNSKHKCILDPELELQNLCMRPAILGSPCSESKHCRVIYGAKCSKNSTCVCRKDFVEYNENLCVKKQIQKKFELRRIPDYVCNNEICEVPANYQSKSKQRRESNSMYGEKCKNNFSCKLKHLPSTVCIKGECRCRDGEQFDYQEFLCKLSKNGIGIVCSNGKNCSAPNSYCDKFETCRCKQYHYYKDGNCILDPAFKCPEGYYFSPITKNCSRYAQAFNGSCDSDEGCVLLNMTNVACKNSKCQCQGDRILLNGECILPIWGQCNSRNNPSDCTIPNSFCSQELRNVYRCMCRESYPANNRTICLPPTDYLFGDCENTYSCGMFHNLMCNGTNCICNDKSVEINGECLPSLGGDCYKSMKCQTANSSCFAWSDCKCDADQGYYESADMKSCLKFAEKVGDNCANNKGCEKVVNSHCEEGKCKNFDSENDVENSE